MKPVVTTTTDFGWESPDMLPGVIWQRAPETRVIALTHEVSAHNILEGALTLWRCTRFFPAGTIHVAVVDPGVGTARRGMAARIGSQFYVGPDNGLFTLVLEQAETESAEIEMVALEAAEYWNNPVCPIFHGRDVFAPVAGHLAAGVPLAALGPAISDPVRLRVPKPVKSEQGLEGVIIHADSFGNLGTNIAADDLRGWEDAGVRLGVFRIPRIVKTFGDGQPGELVALIDSSGFLAVAVVNGDARNLTGAETGDRIVIGKF